MATLLPAPELSGANVSPTAPTPPSHRPKPQRVLACVLCQQRKVKCDRKFPCVNCTKSRVKCVPATLTPRRRRRRLPERELLERLYRYEDLLRHNSIKFEPLSNEPVREEESANAEGGYDSDYEQLVAVGPDSPSSSTPIKYEKIYEAKDIWHAMNQGFRDPGNYSDSDDGVRAVDIKNVWDEISDNTEYLLFGSPKTAIGLSTLHPEPVQIFRLWQIYLDNVNPLLKVTHTPSLQGRIIEATSNVKNINPTLEALMFSIYCMATLSLAVDDCQTVFGFSKDVLLTRFQFGCQQALLNCGFLRSNDRDCLTALYLYLMSVRSRTVPQSLYPILGVAIRIAQRMGIHSESALARCTVLEAEMRRRLWWSLVIFDQRIAEMADVKMTTLAPTWDCKVPLNVNDSDLRLEMKESPVLQGESTEALFCVVRSVLRDFVRHTMFHLELTNPALKPITKDLRHTAIPEGGELVTLEKVIEDKYLKFCDPENPLHFITTWTTRAYLARCHLMEYFTRYASFPVHHREAQREAAFFYALKMLECDTNIVTSPLADGFIWLIQFHFPLVAYLHILQDLRQRPVSKQANCAWKTMNDNYTARLQFSEFDDSPFFKIFAKIILQAWEGCEKASRQHSEQLMPPSIVSSVRNRLVSIAKNAESAETELMVGMDEFLRSMPMSSDYGSLLYGMEGQDSYEVTGLGVHDNTPGQTALNYDVNQLHWNSMDLGLVDASDGETVASTGPSSWNWSTQ